MMDDPRTEHMRTALILSRTAEMLDEALHGRAKGEVREEAYDALAQARRRVRDCDAILWPDEKPIP
jgi:hypothetical protein